MPSTYDDFRREPSIPHQCMHTHQHDGRRCRAMAMHNNYMCFAHRDKVIPPVYENEPFDIPHVLTRPAIQQALGDLAARLASNRMDLKRAGLLAYILQVASCNLETTTETASESVADTTPPPVADAGEIPDLTASSATGGFRPAAQNVGRMRNGRSRPQRRRNHCRLRNLLLRRARRLRALAMNLQAVRTLRGQRHRQRHQLLVLLRNRAVGHRRLVESLVALPRRRRAFAQQTQLLYIRHVVHAHLPLPESDFVAGSGYLSRSYASSRTRRTA